MQWYLYLLFSLIGLAVLGCCLSSALYTTADAVGRWGQALSWFGKTRAPDLPRARAEYTYQFLGPSPPAPPKPGALV